MSQRVGIGYDVHPLVEGRKLFLGGVEFNHTHGLQGHSDADVLIHAIADAILGAIGESDIGHHFPNTDERWRGVSSLVLLQHVRKILDERGAVLENIDSTLVAEAPKIGPRLAEMKAALGGALGLPPERVGVKATSNEKLGFLGRREGMIAMAVASVTVKD